MLKDVLFRNYTSPHTSTFWKRWVIYSKFVKDWNSRKYLGISNATTKCHFDSISLLKSKSFQNKSFFKGLILVNWNDLQAAQAHQSQTAETHLKKPNWMETMAVLRHEEKLPGSWLSTRTKPRPFPVRLFVNWRWVKKFLAFEKVRIWISFL